MISISYFVNPVCPFSLISPALLARFSFSIHFHQFAPRAKPPRIEDQQSYEDFLNYKDWLSQPEAVRIFQNLKDPNLALPLFNQFSTRRDYNPSEAIYCTVIHKLAVAKNFDGIESLMERIKIERRCRLSDGFFRSVIRIYGHSAGRINKAIETLFDMPNYRCLPTVGTFNFVLNLLVSTKQFKVIHEVYAGATQLGVEIDACCLNIIIKGLCECGQIEAAFKVLDEFPEQKCRPNVRSFSTIMHGLCVVGRVDEAFNLLERMEMEGLEPDAIVFNTLISGLRQAGRLNEGIEMFDKMMLKGCNPNPGTYQEVLYCLLDAKKYGEAKVFMTKMIDKWINPSFKTYKVIIQAFCDENMVDDMEWALKQMVFHGFVPKMGMWKQIVHCVISNAGGISEEELENEQMEM